MTYIQVAYQEGVMHVITVDKNSVYGDGCVDCLPTVHSGGTEIDMSHDNLLCPVSLTKTKTIEVQEGTLHIYRWKEPDRSGFSAYLVPKNSE